MDRIDLALEVPAVRVEDLAAPCTGESSSSVAARVESARFRQRERACAHRSPARCNAEADGDFLLAIARPDGPGQNLLDEAASRLRLTARGYHRVLRVARTLADLDEKTQIGRLHLAEALSYRQQRSEF